MINNLVEFESYNETPVFINKNCIMAVTEVFAPVDEKDPEKGTMDYVRVKTLDGTDFDLNEDLNIFWQKLKGEL